ncbi:MAG: hypothetical protein CM15mP120_16890 [Pseudomonadota bacterium]|nr:MAG: hypothetical protein CM15mP120_16890 [Pseudomonadota bacterium]
MDKIFWEATTGTFSLWGLSLAYSRITQMMGLGWGTQRPTLPPFWRSETFNRSVHFSAQICDFLYHAEQRLGSQSDLARELVQKQQFEEAAAAELVDYLKRQREHTRSALPNRTNVLFEHVLSGPAGYQGPDQPQQLVIHTHWGGRINRPWALALDVAWRQHTGCKPELHADNNVVGYSMQKSKRGPGTRLCRATVGLGKQRQLINAIARAFGSLGFFWCTIPRMRWSCIAAQQAAL